MTRLFVVDADTDVLAEFCCDTETTTTVFNNFVTC